VKLRLYGYALGSIILDGRIYIFTNEGSIGILCNTTVSGILGVVEAETFTLTGSLEVITKIDVGPVSVLLFFI